MPDTSTTQAIKHAIHEAARVLWARILPAEETPPAIDPMRFVREVRRSNGGWLVRFHREHTIDWLLSQGLSPIETPPVVDVSVRAIGPFGEEPALGALLQQQLPSIAAEIGIVLSPQGDPIPCTVLWTADEIGVLVGKEPIVHRRLAPGEDRRLAASEMLRKALRRIRDQQARHEATSQQARLWVRLTVERESPLAAQLDWEQTLRNEGFVRGLIPTELGRTRRSYLVGLASEEGIDALAQWLAQQGWQLQTAPFALQVH